MSSTSGDIQTLQGTVGGKSGLFQNLAVTGTTLRPTIPTSVGCYIGQASHNNTAIELCSLSANQSYIDFTQPNTDFKGWNLYIITLLMISIFM